MSYSFSVKANSVKDATGKIREQFDAVVASQPTHVADKEAAVVAAQELVILLKFEEGNEINVSMYGSLSWRAENEFTSANLNISVSTNKPVSPA